MLYPFWDAGISYGVLMATIALVHVFVSHFAIGGGLYLVVAERAARRAGDEARLEHLRGLSRFFMLLTVVFGALTGVGIWFVIGLLNPTATEALIHNFVWAWGIEWSFFVVEVLAAILYYAGWRRLGARDHMTIGWIYFVAAWLSLVVINGIVCFMLTPGAWTETGAFWDGFLNPTYWPSLLLRTGICVMLAGLFGSLVVSGAKDEDLRRRVLRHDALWTLAGLLLAAGGWLLFLGALPERVVEAAGRLTTPAVAGEVLLVAAGALAGLVVLFGLGWPRLQRRPVAIVLLALGLTAFGAYEYYRESARKPWVIPGYMFGNGLLASEVMTYEEEGMLPHMAWRTGDDGADLFRHACQSCHALGGGIADLKAIYEGTDEAYIRGTLSGLHLMRAPMPTFPATSEERDRLAAFIAARVDTRDLATLTGLEGAALGRRVYAARCASCHVVGGHNDKRDALRGLEAEDLTEFLSIEGLAEGMPDFSGTEEELAALVAYLLEITTEEE